MELTTTVGCPLMCNVCPQSSLIKNYTSSKKHLSFYDFKTMVDKLPNHVRIDFSGMAEPWVNSDCNRMFEYVLSMKFKVAIYSTLYGMNKTQSDDFIELIYKYKNQITEFYLHLPDKNMNMRGWKNSDDYEYSIKNVIKLEDSIKKEINFQYMTMNPNIEIHPDLNKFDIKLPNYEWKANTRAGNIKINENIETFTNKTVIHTQRVSCGVSNFYDRNVMLPNGDILLCCMDYSMKHIIGNLLYDSYDDLYLSKGMISLMKENKKNCYSDQSLCKSCHNAKPWPVDVIYETFN